MEGIIEKELDENIFSDEYEYFFCFLFDRFEYMNELWTKELEKRFNKKFKPIWILSAKQNDFFRKENYIIINKKLKEIKSKLNNQDIVYLQDYEDLNKEFSESKEIKEIINKLIEKQDRVFILGFTSSCLEIYNPNVKILGPRSDIATKFDNKIRHIKLFNWLQVPRNNTRVYSTIEEIKEKEKYPFFISASYTSGGHESSVIHTEQGLDIFYSRLRSVNKKNEFLVADLIENIKISPNVNAMVCGEKDTRIICISDQILRGTEYLGNIYPSKASEKHKQNIIKTTKIIGNYLASLGFLGIFGLDFIIDFKGKLYTVDLNPRRQGGYLTNVLMSKKINIPEIELKLALNEEVPKFDYDDFQVNFSWGHSKIRPYYQNMEINDCFKEGSPLRPFEEIGSIFKCIFYPKKSLLIEGNGGYFILTGENYKKVKDKLIKEVEVILSKKFELYEGLD